MRPPPPQRDEPKGDVTPVSAWLVRSRLALGVMGAGVVCTCGSDVLVGSNRGVGEGGTSNTAAGAANAGTSIGGVSGASGDVCGVGGPSLVLPGLSGCTTDLAKRLFPFAICSCNDLAYSGTLTTNSVVLTTDPTAMKGGSVGVNGAYQAGSVGSRLSGSLWVYGDSQLGEEDILGDLLCGGDLTVTGTSTVRKDAHVVGNAQASSLTVAGTYYTDASSSVSIQSSGGGVVRQPVSVVEPCECDSPIDIASVAHSLVNENDNARATIAASDFEDVVASAQQRFPCGRFYLTSLSGTGSLMWSVAGRAVIATDGSVSNSGGLRIELSDDAELDWFIAGDLTLSGPVVIGRVDRPSATRIYVGGRVAFSSNPELYANWFVPNQPFVVSSRTEMWGALHVHSLELSGALSVHYDPAIVDLPSCTEAGKGCSSCRDCANPTPACRNGTCSACESDSDCCPPFRCASGACELETVMQ